MTPSFAHPGEIVNLELDAVINSGWHLYSLTATPPPGPTPTSISVSGDNILLAGAVVEDKPVTEVDPNFRKAVAFHQGQARFVVPVTISRSASPGGLPLTATVTYQTCNDRICLPPTSVRIPFRILIEAGAVRPEYAQVQIQSGMQPAAPAAVVTPFNTTGGAAPTGLLPFVLAAFGAGLLALLTPCVFPLIPVTFGFFTKQVGGERRRLIGLASAYAIGIIVSFTVLGLLAALVFGAAGANRVAANPWFNLFFGILFVVFAFSFFESFIIQLPPSFSRFSRPSAGGLTGVLLMGLAFVFAAFTCTAPFIGTVLVAAASATGAQWVRPLIGMVCFALALALPFFLLALFPTMLTRLPRSGGWMTTFKASLGFLELAYALTYFSKADLVWQAHILTAPVIFALWAVIAIAGALYLLGLLRVSAYPDAQTRLTLGRSIAAVVFALVGFYCLYALTGRPVSGLVLAYLPPQGYGLSGSSTGSNSADPGWLGSYTQALAQAKQDGKPLFVDFTGYTCTNCRYVEQNIFTKPPVSGLLQDRYTRLRLYTDGGKDGVANQALQQKLFGTVALPLYAVISPDGHIAAQLSGSNSSVAQFADFLIKGEQLASSPSAPVNEGVEASPVPPLTRTGGLAWADYSGTALSDAKTAHRPVIVDFTASWCTNCHALERNVFTAPQVAGKLGGFTTLRDDLTDFYGAKNAEIEKRYKIEQLPAVLFLDSRGREVPGTRVTGLVTADDFASRMAKVLAS